MQRSQADLPPMECREGVFKTPMHGVGGSPVAVRDQDSTPNICRLVQEMARLSQRPRPHGMSSTCEPRRCAARRGPGQRLSATAGFHQSRLSGTDSSPAESLPALDLAIRLADQDAELEVAAWLRAKSFYAYPPERKFAGELHQLMVSEEELASLKAARLAWRLDPGARERSACLVAVCPAAQLPDGDPKLVLEGGAEALAGTLDVHAVKALEGEALIGDSSNAAYLANVCTSTAARRRGVGEGLLQAARALAREWGAEDLYVHTMAVNEIAMKFYLRCGFVVEKEESSNQAHYRGRCLDGVEGLARTVLLKDTLLHR